MGKAARRPPVGKPSADSRLCIYIRRHPETKHYGYRIGLHGAEEWAETPGGIFDAMLHDIGYQQAVVFWTGEHGDRIPGVPDHD